MDVLSRFSSQGVGCLRPQVQSGVGSLSPKGKPSLLLEDDDVVAGGVTYVFAPGAGSQGMHHVFHVMSQANSQDLMQILW